MQACCAAATAAPAEALGPEGHAWATANPFFAPGWLQHAALVVQVMLLLLGGPLRAAY